MTPRNIDTRLRKETILRIVVSEYIKNVNPISSGLIAQQYSLDISPATIRNILAELEDEGYLTHPHTSAGRVPTQAGYRYYVDNLMLEINLLEDEKSRIKEEYDRDVTNLEKLLEKTSEVITDITHYTSIISVDGRDDRIFLKGTSHVVEYPSSQDVGKIRDILVALEEKEHILAVLNRRLERRIRIYIGHEIACRDIESCSLAVSSYQSPSGVSGRIGVLGPTYMDYKKVVSTLDYLSELMGTIL